MNCYYVEPGDTPMSIAGRFTGDPLRARELVQQNPGKPRVQVGAHLTFQSLQAGEPLDIPLAWLTPDVVASGYVHFKTGCIGVLGLLRVRQGPFRLQRLPWRLGVRGLLRVMPPPRSRWPGSPTRQGWGHAARRVRRAAHAGAPAPVAPGVGIPRGDPRGGGTGEPRRVRNIRQGVGDTTASTPTTISPMATGLVVALAGLVTGFAVAYAYHEYG